MDFTLLSRAKLHGKTPRAFFLSFILFAFVFSFVSSAAADVITPPAIDSPAALEDATNEELAERMRWLVTWQEILQRRLLEDIARQKTLAILAARIKKAADILKEKAKAAAEEGEEPKDPDGEDIDIGEMEDAINVLNEKNKEDSAAINESIAGNKKATKKAAAEAVAIGAEQWRRRQLGATPVPTPAPPCGTHGWSPANGGGCVGP